MAGVEQGRPLYGLCPNLELRSIFQGQAWFRRGGHVGTVFVNPAPNIWMGTLDGMSYRSAIVRTDENGYLSCRRPLAGQGDAPGGSANG